MSSWPAQAAVLLFSIAALARADEPSFSMSEEDAELVGVGPA